LIEGVIINSDYEISFRDTLPIFADEEIAPHKNSQRRLHYELL